MDTEDTAERSKIGTRVEVAPGQHGRTFRQVQGDAVMVGAALIALPRASRAARTAAAALVIVGVTPLAVTTWWSVVTPVIALMAVLVFVAGVRAGRTARTVAAAHNGAPRPR
jgi:hypothetical protein